MSEQELEALSYPGAPRMGSNALPGAKATAAIQLSHRYESMARGGGDNPLVFDQGFGVTVKDPDGNLFIDLSAGVGVNSVGRCHPEVVKTITEQAHRLMHGSDISNTRRSELAQRISQVMPDGLRDNCITYFTQSGSDAVESALKFAKRVTGRHQIIAFHGAYHGVWNGSNALTTGNQYRSGYGPFMGGVIHAPYPYAYRFPFDTSHKSAERIAGEYVDYLLNTKYTAADDVAAVIVESLQGEGGYVPPAPEFFQLLRAACDKSGALLIVDEVQSGAGRTGKMWAIEHAGVKPDGLLFGKGMGGDLPMAGFVLRADLAKKIPAMSQPNTFAANALSAAVCLKNIELLQDPRLDLINRAHQLGTEVMQKIRDANSPRIGEVRGRGLMIGLEMVEDKTSRAPLAPERMGQILGRCFQGGVILVPCGRNGNVIRIMPSLTVSRAYLSKAVEILLEAIKAV
ncbi:MAG: aspartate aminotransferase family protein [Proteobacteria bacterium]|nr:aspartate aminotransferase family protein [Pseudomonadota bacterium]